MAIAPPGSRCSLTNEAFKPGEDCFQTSGDFLPRSDPLHKHCGQPMQWSAYAKWDQRPRFARAYVDAWIKANRKNPFWWTAHLDDEIYISVNPQRGIEEASVRLMAIGTDIRVPLGKWHEWIAQPEKFNSLHALEKEALVPLLPRLREKFPDAYAVVDAIDPAEKKPRGK